MANTYVVTAPLVIVKVQDGSDVYLYVGATVPAGVADADVKRLLDDGMVATAKDAEKAAAAAPDEGQKA